MAGWILAATFATTTLWLYCKWSLERIRGREVIRRGEALMDLRRRGGFQRGHLDRFSRN